MLLLNKLVSENIKISGKNYFLKLNLIEHKIAKD